jgi:hypothetical protein
VFVPFATIPKGVETGGRKGAAPIKVAFLGRLKAALDERELEIKGITTDGAALYPEPIRTVFGDVPH